MQWVEGALLAFLGAGTVLYGIGIYNGLIRLKYSIDQAWSNIDVLLKQRNDEVPELVETVKGYVAHERDVLTRVINPCA